MEIKSTTIVTTAEAKTDNAVYQIEYSIANGVLVRVYASMYENNSPGGSEPYIGSISYENGTINCALPMSSKMTGYFEDFELFLEEIKEILSK